MTGTTPSKAVNEGVLINMCSRGVLGKKKCFSDGIRSVLDGIQKFIFM